MTQSAKQFWKWFEKNNQAYLFINEVDPEINAQLQNKLKQKLHAYCENLWFEIGGHPNNEQELIITAEGNTDYFGHVEVLINAAPTIPNWKVSAFIPPREADFKLKFEDVELNASEMWFESLENPEWPEAIGINVCIKNYDLVKDNGWLMPAVYKVLDYVLGEQSFALDIEHIEVGEVTDEPEEEGLMKLLELRAFVRRKKSAHLKRRENGSYSD